MDTWVAPDLPPTCENAPKLSAPKIDPYPNPTVHARQPFRGVAAGAARITARVGAVTFAPVDVGADGRFCIEAQLIPDAVNTVTFTPWDPISCPGIETTVTLSHKTVAAADAGVTTLQNVAKGQPVSSQDAPDKGSLSYANDGDPKSTVTFSFWDWDWGGTCDKYTWVRVDLGKVYNVTKVKVLWPPQVGNDYGRCYGVLLSSATAPVDPDPSQIQDWESVKEESNGTPQDQVILINPTAARWAALLLYENASTSLTETFVLGDFEVWGQDPNAVPPPPPDRCE
ncbi:MAG: discoidin domain-containing protein [Deltaproteobacteria bacterium]|nr:discoidin domain-containing protein [Deltaproteobacteria bacterium]